jgi:TonB family protein
MPLWQQGPATEVKLSIGNDSAETSRRQLLIALTLLLVALVLTLTKDREFWFPSPPAVQSESEPAEEVLHQRMPQSAAALTTQPVVPGRPKLKPDVSHPAAEPKPGVTSAAVVANRTVLPPLEVEVVAGDQHQPIRESNNSVNVDLQSHTPPASEPPSSVQEAANSAGGSGLSGGVHLSPKTAEVVARSVEPNYPLLAKQMKIQGAVVLEALIGREGNIQHLEVLSGPAILAAAAQEAVQQWRFRPYLLSGKAVETESRITVGFTISTR